MKNKISSAIQTSLDFIDELYERDFITYPPIDFEIYQSTDDELAETLRCWFGSDRLIHLIGLLGKNELSLRNGRPR
ncbi:hypothetical protein [Myxosarcina sp. GI1]|uniref:hypothetical protein n=1 Tax=Myxosarcina sp. GI1 TaxID=1541065 RepID=UPI0005621A6A|nr:hypothetical protein [Myxosarcina sp. GI1]